MQQKYNNINEKQWIEIAEIRQDVCWLKKEIQEIRQQVFNHLPSQINNIRSEFSDKLDDIKSKLFYGFIVIIATTIITQIILKLFI